MFADRKPRFGRVPPYHKGWAAFSWEAQRRRANHHKRQAERLVALQVADVKGEVERTWLIRGSWMSLDAGVPTLQTMWPELCCTLLTRGIEDGTVAANSLAIPVPSGMLRLLTELTTVLGIHDEPPVAAGRKALWSLMWWLLSATWLCIVLLVACIVPR